MRALRRCLSDRASALPWLRLALPLLLLVLSAAPGRADPPTIRFGTSTATEETMWLLLAQPELGPHQNKTYHIDYTRFPGADKRFQAFEAGALDLAAVSANAALFAAAQGIDFKMIASVSRESKRGFYTLFMVRDDSPLKTVADLKGRNIGINGFSGSGHLWTRTVLEKNGLSENDVTLVPLPFPAQGEALKSGQIDVGMFPQPFAAIAEHRGGVRTLYTSKDAAPDEEELSVIIGHDDFLKANRAAVQDMLSDLVVVTHYYAEHPKEARLTLIKTKMVGVDPDIYVPMKDYYRDPGLRVDLTALQRMQALQIKAGFQQNAADLNKLVDLSYLPQ